MDYVRILYTYIVEDFMYSGYLLLTLLLPCLIYQGLMEIKAKQNSRRVPAKYYFGVYVMLVYLWMVFKVTGIGLLADIVRLKDAISGGYNWNPLAGLDKGFVLNIIMFFAAWPIDTMYMEEMQKHNKCHGYRIFTVVNN